MFFSFGAMAGVSLEAQSLAQDPLCAWRDFGGGYLWPLALACNRRSHSALVIDNARYMHSRTCHSQSKNISPLFVTELTVKTMRRYSWGFCEPQGKCTCIRERNGLSGLVAFRFVSCRRVAFRLLSCRRCVRPLVHLRFLSFCVDASWRKRKKQTKTTKTKKQLLSAFGWPYE